MSDNYKYGSDQSLEKCAVRFETMSRFRFWLAVVAVLQAVSAGAVAAPSVNPAATRAACPPDVERVATSRVLVNYRLKPGAEPVTRVDLYYTIDDGANWKKAPDSLRAAPPISFDAPGDGTYGLYLVFHTDSTTSAKPTTGTQPHRRVHVDRRAPIAQLLAIKPDKRFNLTRLIHIRWRATDDDLADRPVAVRYRAEPAKSFKLIADALPAEGSARWTVPEGTSGPVEFKITAVDRAGNRTEYVDDRLRITDEAASLLRADNSNAPAQDVNEPDEATTDQEGTDDSLIGADSSRMAAMSEPDAGERVADPAAAKEAKKQYDLGTWHRLRGETGVAIAKYSEAIRLQPGFLAARNDLAALLCLRGELDDAEQEYRRIVEMDGKHASALRGLALVQARKRNYRSAHETLQKLLLLAPTDADAWMDFGDVCLFMGDRSAAREAWTKSMRFDGASRELKQRAAKRLEIYRGDESTALGGEAD